MKHLTEYAIFVMQAHLAGQEIETVILKEWYIVDKLYGGWNWHDYVYRIKLPEGWEYVIEDGEIAFREVKRGEYFLTNKYELCQYMTDVKCDYKRPVIKRVQEDGE